MVDYQTISIVFTGLSISLAAFYYINTLRNSQRNQEISLQNQELTLKSQEQQLVTRQAQLFMNIYSYTYTLEFWTYYREIMEQWTWEDYDEWYKKYRSDSDTYNKFAIIATFFEGMGVLVNRTLIDVTFVDDLMSGPILQFWQKFGPIIHEDRSRRNISTMWEWCEYLYDRVKEVSEKEHGAKHVVDVERLSRRLITD